MVAAAKGFSPRRRFQQGRRPTAGDGYEPPRAQHLDGAVTDQSSHGGIGRAIHGVPGPPIRRPGRQPRIREAGAELIPLV